MRLDDSARMNTPGKAAGNWAWRVGETWVWDCLKDESEQLRKLVEMYDRLPPPRPRAAEVAEEALAEAEVAEEPEGKAAEGEEAAEEQELAGRV
jgi:hypothetical protein